MAFLFSPAAGSSGEGESCQGSLYCPGWGDVCVSVLQELLCYIRKEFELHNGYAFLHCFFQNRAVMVSKVPAEGRE